MYIVDFEHLYDTTSYVCFQVQFTTWYCPWIIKTKRFLKEKSTGEFYNVNNFKRPVGVNLLHQAWFRRHQFKCPQV